VKSYKQKKKKIKVKIPGRKRGKVGNYDSRGKEGKTGYRGHGNLTQEKLITGGGGDGGDMDLRGKIEREKKIFNV